jgi:ABC-type transport system involved in multi-copper enzyme maturation permease subunit
MLNGVVELNGHVWRGHLFFLLAATLFAALFLLLSMGVSVLARTSASALVFLITAWTVLIVVVPQTSYLIATQSVDSVGVYWETIDEYENEVQAALEREGVVPREPELALQDNYAVERRSAKRMQDMGQEKDRMRRKAAKQQREQFKTAMHVNLLSPGFAFQYTTEAFLGAGVQKVEHFHRHGWRYREHLREFISARDAADVNSPHVLFVPEFVSEKELDASLMPRFKSTRVSLSESVANGVVPIVVLVLETAAAFFFALWAFNRAEIAGG